MIPRRWNGMIPAAAAAACLFAAGIASAQDQLPWSGRQAANDAYSPGSSGYGGGDTYQPGNSGSADDAYRPGYGQTYENGQTYDNGQNYGNGQGDEYPPQGNGQATGPGSGQDYGNGSGQGYGNGSTYTNAPPSDPGYGEPYSPVPQGPPPSGQGYSDGGPPNGGGYDKNEIISAGHQFFGSISQGLASGVEYAFQSQGRPNGYILGQDAGGAFVLGLRYGEGTLYTKDAGSHKVFWQGPSVGYDAGAEGSKTMVLVYNMRDPSEIYNRFGGVQGSAYLVGGVSVQFQKHGDVTLGVIRSGVGLRLGANVGYLNYTRSPTWNPL